MLLRSLVDLGSRRFLPTLFFIFDFDLNHPFTSSHKYSEMYVLLSLAPELVRHLLGHLQGEELPVALTNTRLLRVARSLHEDRMLSAQRKSAYLSSEELTMFVLNHDMLEVNVG